MEPGHIPFNGLSCLTPAGNRTAFRAYTPAMYSTNQTNLRVAGLITDEQLTQSKYNLEFKAVAACSDHKLDTYADLMKELIPYSFALWSSEETRQTVASGHFHVNHNGRVAIMVSRLQPRGLAEVFDIPALLRFCNIAHEDGGKLMWVEALNRTLNYMLEDIKVCVKAI